MVSEDLRGEWASSSYAFPCSFHVLSIHHALHYFYFAPLISYSTQHITDGHAEDVKGPHVENWYEGLLD
jgi:hypothetical protein